LDWFVLLDTEERKDRRKGVQVSKWGNGFT
jgi:hypothetical protein